MALFIISSLRIIVRMVTHGTCTRDSRVTQRMGGSRPSTMAQVLRRQHEAHRRQRTVRAQSDLAGTRKTWRYQASALPQVARPLSRLQMGPYLL